MYTEWHHTRQAWRGAASRAREQRSPVPTNHPFAPTEFPTERSAAPRFEPAAVLRCAMRSARGGDVGWVTPGGGYQRQLSPECLVASMLPSAKDPQTPSSPARLAGGSLGATRVAGSGGPSCPGGHSASVVVRTTAGRGLRLVVVGVRARRRLLRYSCAAGCPPEGVWPAALGWACVPALFRGPHGRRSSLAGRSCTDVLRRGVFRTALHASRPRTRRLAGSPPGAGRARGQTAAPVSMPAPTPLFQQRLWGALAQGASPGPRRRRTPQRPCRQRGPGGRTGAARRRRRQAEGRGRRQAASRRRRANRGRRQGPAGAATRSEGGAPPREEGLRADPEAEAPRARAVGGWVAGRLWRPRGGPGHAQPTLEYSHPPRDRGCLGGARLPKSLPSPPPYPRSGQRP